MVLKVAIVGLSQTTHNQAPFHDPEWEVWGLPWDEGYWRYCDRLFEMHDIRLLQSEADTRVNNYFDRLEEIDVPLYMQDQYFPNATKFPFDEVAETTGYYWNSSPAYAIALAIHEGADEIAIYGIDMKGDDEYGYQKPNIEHLLGIAKGRGIKVHVPDESPVMKFNPSGIWFCDMTPDYVERYGWLG